ncbi:HEAT repeat domain-containing protein [Halalkalicoccus ordinarius]|uniref:HEAT repeat domain-containing protein n=1 Tax=Halalkalicoccus ordinarius TaxID=3116651 RepID=UPI00300F1A2B
MSEDEEHAEDAPEAEADASDEQPADDPSDPSSEGDGEPETEEAEDTPDDADGESESEESEAEDGEGEDGEPDPETEGDDESAESEETDEESEDEVDDPDEAEESDERLPEQTLPDRLDGVEAALEEAETEDDLDDVEASLDSIEADLEDAELPEPDEDDEDAEDPREELESRLSELRDELEEQRGPYAEDVIEGIEEAGTTIDGTEWTEKGEGELVAPVESFVESLNAALGTDVDLDGREPEALVSTLETAAKLVGDAELHPDEDEKTIAELLEAVDELQTGIDDAEEWDDLTVREKLDAHGFYDVLDHRKDYPPEWQALKIYEKRNEPEPILLALEMLGSDFMEEHCIHALKLMGHPAALDAMTQRADKRDKAAIEVLGKIGSDEPLEMLLEYAEADSDPQLQLTTLTALGEIGSEEATQGVADRLTSDNPEVRSRAARALGMIGDTRAIAPLSDVLADDDSDTVRASAAWALNQIGIEEALEEVGKYADDRAYLVQSEAEKAG